MTASPIERPARAGLTLAGAALLAVLPLSPLWAAADPAPTSLLPSSEPLSPVPASSPPSSPFPAGPSLAPLAPAPAMPTLAPPASSGREAFPEVSPRAEKVQVQDLGVLDPDSTGVLDRAHGGFGTEMWAGATLAIMQKVLPGLPANPPSRQLRSLQRRLLLSMAAAPAGPSAGEAPLKMRAAKLWAMGESEGLVALLKAVPTAAMTPELRRLEADAALLAGDGATACGAQPILSQQLPNDVYPAELQVFCQFTGGKGNEAGLGIDLLREQKIVDPAFFAAADALAGVPPGKLDVFANASPLALALARAAKLPLPETAASAAIAVPAALRAIAQMPDVSPEARLLATERAESLGLVDPERLRTLYEGMSFTAEEIDAPLRLAATEKGARSRALLYRAALQQIMPAARAEIISRALSLAGEGTPAYFATARLYAPQIAGLKPDPALAAFAPVAVRALFAAGHGDSASPWLTLARQGGSEAALAPLLQLTQTEADRPLSAARLAGWRKARADGSQDGALRRIAVVYGLLSALGNKLPAEEWAVLLDAPASAGGPQPRPGLWHGLRLASEDLRLGETVMMALATLGEAPLNQADPVALYRVVAALRLIGLESEARALAVEAAIANGV